MALTDEDRKEIANIIRQEITQAGSQTGRQGAEEALAAVSAAVAPLPGITGNWELASAGTGGQQEAGALDAPVEFDRLENNLHAGGRVMVTNFRGRFQEGVEAGGTQMRQGERFNGTLVLAYDAPNDQYIELYADDLGKVQLSTTENWEVDDETLRLYHDEYVAEYSSNGPTEFTVNIYEAGRRGRRRGTEALGAPIKSATLKRQ